MKIEIFVDFKDNKIFVVSENDIILNLEVYDWNVDYDKENSLIYNISKEQKSLIHHWYSPSFNINTLDGIYIRCFENNILVYENKFKNYDLYFKNKKNINFALLITHFSIGDILFTTPSIRKLYRKYGKKVIVFTYRPDIFINNPYVTCIFINRTSIFEWNSIPENYRNDKNLLIRKIELPWQYRFILDYRIMVADSIGLKLSKSEKRMDFFPDDYVEIENLPEKYICIGPSNTTSDRTWDVKKWQKFINLIEYHIPIVMIGNYSEPKDLIYYEGLNIKNGLNLINKTSLSQSYHIINRSEVFVSMNNGLLNLALCGFTDIVALSSPSNIKPFLKDHNYIYVKGKCKLFCLTSSDYNIDKKDNLIKKNCFLDENKKFECHPEPEKVYEKVLKKITNNE